MSLPGVDVSVFQGEPGQWRAEAGEISWAATKFTELSPGHSYVNPDALADWSALKAAGHFRIAYLFGHASTTPAATVNHFLGALHPVLADGDGIAVDLEVNDGFPASHVAAWASTVLTLLRQVTDRRPLLYTDLSFAEAGNCAGLGGYPLWIADPSSPAGHPRVPRPWKTWAIHQHVITGPIDRDVANYTTVSAMRAALGKPAPHPKPASKEEPVLLNTGQGAVTPIAFRDADTKVRFFPASAEHTGLQVEFNGHPTVSVTLTGGAGSAPIPKGVDGCRVVRGASGATVAVSALAVE